MIAARQFGLTSPDYVSVADFLCRRPDIDDDTLAIAALHLYAAYHFFNYSRHSSPLPPSFSLSIYMRRIAQQASFGRRDVLTHPTQSQAKRFRS